MTAAIIPLLHIHTLNNAIRTVRELELCCKYAGDALCADDLNGPRQAVRQLREIAAGAAKIIAEIEGK